MIIIKYLGRTLVMRENSGNPLIFATGFKTDPDLELVTMANGVRLERQSEVELLINSRWRFRVRDHYSGINSIIRCAVCHSPASRKAWNSSRKAFQS